MLNAGLMRRAALNISPHWQTTPIGDVDRTAWEREMTLGWVLHVSGDVVVGVIAACSFLVEVLEEGLANLGTSV
jgi:hypothetical protein